MLRATALVLLATHASAHGSKELPVNPALGVPGFPDCVRSHPASQLTVEEAADDLVCRQRDAPPDSIQIATIGDSITAGVCSTGGNHTYPAQLQILLDAKYGKGKYTVTNLGACGATMLKKGDSPYWQRAQYDALTKGTWDIVTIMLGTNDAKDPSSRGPNNWQHDCGGPGATTLEGCSFASDYADMVKVVRGLGRDVEGPKVYGMIPPPLMELDAYGMNSTVINQVFPKLVPLISKANKLDGTIDIFEAMGGLPPWSGVPSETCDHNATSSAGVKWAPCAWWCDGQSCDQCHPNNDGYAHLAPALLAGLGL